MKTKAIGIFIFSPGGARLYQSRSDRHALLLRFTSLLHEVMILKEPSPQLVTKLIGTEEYEKENSQSERD